MGFCRFENLQVFKLSESLCDQIWAVVSGWSQFEKDTVGKQLVKAADSVGANIAEGSGRGSPKDNRRFVKISRGSLHETIYWLRRATISKLITHTQWDSIEQLINQIAPMLNAYLASIGRGTQTHQSQNTKHKTPNTKHQTQIK